MKTNDLYNAVHVTHEIDGNSEIDVNIFTGPIGGYGFRSGWWDIKINGIKFKLYDSIPHICSLEEQKNRLIASAREAIQRTIDAETYVCSVDNTVCLRYNPQIIRVNA